MKIAEKLARSACREVAARAQMGPEETAGFVAERWPGLLPDAEAVIAEFPMASTPDFLAAVRELMERGADRLAVEEG